MSVRVAVFASGGGTNLQALLDHFEGGRYGAEVALVVSDRPDAGALDRAARAGVPTRVLTTDEAGNGNAARAMIAALEAARTDLVALAGYVRLVPEDVVRRFPNRIVNVHPALLPAFGGRGMYGARVHRAVLQSGCRVTGPTVHLVNERYDEGRILSQWPVPVLEGDTAESLARRVLRAEHVLYPATVEWLASVLSRAAGEDEPEPEPERATGGVPESAEAGFRLSDGWEPDRAGIRRMLGLD